MLEAAAELNAIYTALLTGQVAEAMLLTAQALEKATAVENEYMAWCEAREEEETQARAARFYAL